MEIKNRGKRLGLSIYGRNRNIHIFKTVIRILGNPKYICIKTTSGEDSIAITPIDAKQAMSFKTPEDLFMNKSRQFVITSKGFVETIFKANGLNCNNSYRLIPEI